MRAIIQHDVWPCWQKNRREKKMPPTAASSCCIYMLVFWGGFLCWCHYLQAPSSLQPPATFIETIKKESARGLNSIWRPAKNDADCVFSRRTLQPRDLVTRLCFCCCWRQQVTNIHICNCADFHSVLFAEFQRPPGHTRHLESVGGSAAALFSWYVAHSPRKHRLAFSMCSRERVRERDTACKLTTLCLTCTMKRRHTWMDCIACETLVPIDAFFFSGVAHALLAGSQIVVGGGADRRAELVVFT